MNGPAEPQSTRPSDEARRALRAARERDARDAEGDSDPDGASAPEARPGDVVREALRRGLQPSGAAEEAVDDAGPDERTASESARRGEVAWPGGEEGDSPSAGGEGSAASTGASAPGRRPGDVVREALRRGVGPAAAAGEAVGDAGPGEQTAPAAARPGDVAREALRVAREQARRSRTEAEGVGVDRKGGAGRRAGAETPPGSRGRGRTPRRGTENRAQDVRDLLAGAFRMPDAEGEVGTAREGAPPRGHDGEGALRGDSAAQGRGGAEDGLVASGDGAVGDGDAQPDGGLQDHDLVDRDPRDRDARENGPREDTPRDDGSWGQSLRDRDTHENNPRDHRPGGAGSWDRAPRDHALRDDDLRENGPRGKDPRSMAAPGRDGDLRRTFAAFPPRPAGGTDAFAETWWGNAWVTALEEGALDAARLVRGRGYAGKGSVDAITVTPGLVLAYVHGSRPRPYRVQVRLRTLSDADWDRFLDAAAERPGHIAALLDKEVPQSLAECGVALLPGPGDLEPHCSCPDSGHPCKHAAALCYQTARLLDEDPFVLFLLRGRGERELLDALSRRNAARAARAAQEQEPAPLPGVRASDAVKPRTLPPLPAPLPPPAHPQQPPVYPGAPGGPDPFALDQLATDAAARAHALLTAGRDPVAELTLWQDAVRLAAARPGSGLTAATRALYSSLASAAGRTPSDLARAVAAWRQGGLEGLTVLEEPWDPPAGRFDRARPLLLAADLPAFRPWRNQLTHPRGHAQLRLGRGGLWYAYESEPGHDDWWPRGTPDLDPVGALTGLGAPGEL